jgi:hypothetical protein
MSDNDTIRRGAALAIVKPNGARDCDCTRCTCGDEIEVSLWDQSKRHSDEIAALPAADPMADPRVKALVEAADKARIILAEYEPHPLPVLGELLAALAEIEGD